MAKKAVPSSSSSSCCVGTVILVAIVCAAVAVYGLRYLNQLRVATAEECFHGGGAPVGACNTMGPYDGIRLPKDAVPYDLQLPTRQNATVQGYQVPLRQPYPATIDHSEHYPTVDGTEDTPRDMFMFAHNQSHPECCPSTYSTSTGCVCTTPAQRRWLFTRGQATHGQSDS